MGLQRVRHDLLTKQQQLQCTQITLKSKQIEAALKLNKVGRLLFFGGKCSRISGGTPEAQSRLCVCRVGSFPAVP